jgi:hypothetical protein
MMLPLRHLAAAPLLVGAIGKATPPVVRNWLATIGVSVLAICGSAALCIALAALPCQQHAAGVLRGCAVLHPVRDGLFLTAIIGAALFIPALLLAALVHAAVRSSMPQRSEGGSGAETTGGPGRSKRAPRGAMLVAVLSTVIGGYLAGVAAESHSFTTFVPPFGDLVVVERPNVVAASWRSTSGPGGRTESVDFHVNDREVWRYQSHLPHYSEVARLAGPDAGPITLRASPGIGQHDGGDSKRRARVRQIFEVWSGPHRIVGYEEVAAATRISRYPGLFYFGIALIAFGALVAVRCASARRAHP